MNSGQPHVEENVVQKMIPNNPGAASKASGSNIVNHSAHLLGSREKKDDRAGPGVVIKGREIENSRWPVFPHLLQNHHSLAQACELTALY